MSRRVLLQALTVLGASLSCREIAVPDYNFANVEALSSAPTKPAVIGAVVGMLDGLRLQSVSAEGRAMGMLGKECYYLPTTVGWTVFISGPMNPSGQLIGLGWGVTYNNILAGAVILGALDKVSDFTTQQREGIRGFVKTAIALELLLQVRVRDTAGIVVAYTADPAAPVPPIVSKDEALTRIVELLDEARVHLLAAGPTFAFPLHSGFTSFGSFNTPASFILFNRGIKARAEILRSNWPAALTAVEESFVDVSSGTSAALARGVYHVFGSTDGIANGLFDSAPLALYVHPSILSGAKTRTSGQLDLRLTQKTAAGVTRSLYGVVGTHKFTIYPNSTAPRPMLRNEELILMRAEARFHTGDVTGALADINFVRVNSGGLALLSAFADSIAFVDELLYNRTYSLLLERGHRWVDARRYGRLDQLPKVNTHLGEVTFPFVMFPQTECDPRSPKPQPGCSAVAGK